jgi:DNA-binding XRE family transcriptional regulator
MAKLTKTDAAKMIGVARQTIYEYIKEGRISADADGSIDTSELIRAGFELRLPDSQERDSGGHDLTLKSTDPDISGSLQPDHPHTAKLIESYEKQIDSLERELSNAAQREQRLITLLEQEQKQRQLYLPAPATKRSGGFLSRVFTRNRSEPPAAG